MLPHKYGFRRLEHVHLPPGQTDLPDLLRAMLALWMVAAGLAILGVSSLAYLLGATILPEQFAAAPDWFLPLQSLGFSHLQLVPLCGALWLATGIAVQKEKTASAFVMGLIALAGSILISL